MRFVGQQNRNARRRGFTLPEALATLVLVGVVLPIAMRGVTGAMQAAASAKHTAEATELARHKLTELSLSTDAGSLSGNGDFAPDHPEYRWSVTTTQANYGVTEYKVEVKWTAQGTERSLALSSMFFPVSSITTATTTSGASGSGTGAGATR